MGMACVDEVLACLALLYWAASFVVLLLRLVWPDFRRLAAYGGHGNAPEGRTETPAGGESRTLPALFIKAVQTSPLGSVRVTRKQSFTSFYVTGVVTSTSLLLMNFYGSWRVSTLALFRTEFVTAAVPSALFALHCAVRLAETRCVQRFRPHDTVTLFAAVAGSTFYAAAAVSSAVPTTVSATPSLRWLQHSTNLQWVFAMGAAAHLSVQAVQVVVHTILARLRRPAGTAAGVAAESSCALEDGVWRYVQAELQKTPVGNTVSVSKDAAGSSTLHGSWCSYRFPYRVNPVFQLVLDPHYTCEVLLYLINTALMALCVLPHPLQPVPVETAAQLWGHRCATVGWLSVLAGAAVTVFTLINLSITAAEHRCFWNTSNAARREAAAALARLLSRVSSGAGEEGGGKSNALPPPLVDTASRMLKERFVEEELPQWNVVPLLW